MKTRTKVILGAGALLALYLLYKRRTATPAYSAFIGAQKAAAIQTAQTMVAA